MEVNEAADTLKQMRDKYGKALGLHLFAIKYADELGYLDVGKVLASADVSASYNVEINKGRNIARYVTLDSSV